MSMQDVNIEFEVPTLPEMDVSLEIVTNGTFWGNIEGNITEQTDLQNALNDKQDVLTAGDNIQIEDNVISATDTTYTAGEGISIEDNVISNTQTSAEWGNIEGDIADQTDLIDLIDTKIDIEATARENNDLALQNGINTLNDDLTAEISNRGTADGILQGNIDTLSGTVTSNYTTLDGKISDNKTAIDNHIADKTNPHEVSKAQVGLGNVDNTSDLNKPISTATQTALDGKVPTSRTVNGKALTSDITLTASDVDALPDTTTINDLTTAEQQSALNSGATSTNIGQIATNTQNISNEVTNRQNADNALQSQIDALVVASDVFDIVGTYAELQAYDISTVPVNDIIKVLVDSTHNNAATYYRCVENDNVKSWSYIGAEGAYYTKSEADNRFVEQTTTINGQALSNNITLDAEDVGALPDSTTIGNGTLTIQKNGSTIDSFGANDTGNTTVNITVPTDTGDLTNNAGYTKNVGTVTSVNNTQPDSNGNVTLSIPAAQVNSDWNASSGVAQILNKPTLSTVATTGDYDDLTNKPTIPDAQIQSDWNQTITTAKDYIKNKPTIPTVPTNVSAFTNDSNFIPNTATGSNSLTIQGTATSRSSSINIGVGSSATDSFCTVIGRSATATKDNTVVVGYNAKATDTLATALGQSAEANGVISTAIGSSAKATGNLAIQIGYGTNSTNLSMAVGFGTDKEYQLLDGTTGLIPDARISSNIARTSDLSTVATSGSYNDLSDKPTIPAAQVQANWNETDNTSKAYIQNKPTIPSTSNFVTTNTAQNISARKTFVGEKAINFKQSASTNKLGFTLYNSSNTEVGGLEYNPSSNILALNAPKTANTLLGFRYWSDNNIIVPKPSSSGNYYLPLSFKNGSSTVTTNSSGVADLSNLIPTIATSVSASSTNAETVGAKLFYDTCGDIETLLSEV